MEMRANVIRPYCQFIVNLNSCTIALARHTSGESPAHFLQYPLFTKDADSISVKYVIPILLLR